MFAKRPSTNQATGLECAGMGDAADLSELSRSLVVPCGDLASSAVSFFMCTLPTATPCETKEGYISVSVMLGFPALMIT